MEKLSKQATIERNEAIERVKTWIKESPKNKFRKKPQINVALRNVSRSGMSRTMAFYIPTRDGGMIDATWSIGKILGYPVKRTPCGEGLHVGGCGMDMGFAVVYELGCALWPKGTPRAHSTRNGEPDKHGGYAILHNWI